MAKPNLNVVVLARALLAANEEHFRRTGEYALASDVVAHSLAHILATTQDTLVISDAALTDEALDKSELVNGPWGVIAPGPEEFQRFRDGLTRLAKGEASA